MIFTLSLSIKSLVLKMHLVGLVLSDQTFSLQSAFIADETKRKVVSEQKKH